MRRYEPTICDVSHQLERAESAARLQRPLELLVVLALLTLPLLSGVLS